MPELSNCLWCGYALQLDAGGRWVAQTIQTVRCGAFRMHHPNLDIPNQAVLNQPAYLERWLATPGA